MGKFRDCRENAQRELLRLLSTTPVEPGAKLDDGDWVQLEEIARQHLLMPFLHRTLTDDGRVQELPTDLQKVFADEFRTSVFRALSLQMTVRRVETILQSANMDYVLLKGARLAWGSYPHPAMRPMRDIDILVRPADAVVARQLLLANGCSELDHGSAPEHVALEKEKHLSSIRDDVTGVMIEVHIRLFEPHLARNPDASMMQSERLVDRRTRLSASELDWPVLPVEEALLHCLVHAVYDSRFTSGPILLSDIRYLLDGEIIDWSRFWRLADEGGWSRGCVLAFRLVEKLHGPQPIDWMQFAKHEIPEQILEKFSFALMTDLSLKRDIFIETDRGLSEGAPGFLRFARLSLPAKHQLKEFGQTRSDSFLVWGLYPAWLGTRLWRTLKSRFSRRWKHDLDNIRCSIEWLGV